MTSSVANISDSSVDHARPGILISGGTVVFKAPIKAELTVRLYVDDQRLFDGTSTRDNDLTVRWKLNPPIIFKHRSCLRVTLTGDNNFPGRRKFRAEASASFYDCQRQISSYTEEFKGQ